MRLANYLNEKYHTMVRTRLSKDTVTVFVNPTMKEMKSIDDYVRFLAIANKKAYVWKWDGEVHNTMYKTLGLGSDYHSDVMSNKALGGEAKFKSGKYVVTNCDSMRVKATYNDDYIRLWDWLNKYIDITDYFNKLYREKWITYEI